MSNLITRRTGLTVFLVLSLLLIIAVPWAQAATAEENLLNQIRQYVNDLYVEPVGPDVLNQPTIKALLENLNDPYSYYFTPEEFQEFWLRSSGSFSGVGMEVELVGDHVTVVAPLKGSPAAKVGIKPGDRILQIDGNNVVGEPLETVVSMIRGQAGTSVVLTLSREGEPSPVIVVITREVIKLELVGYQLLPGKIGYIQLSNFASDAGSQVAAAVNELKSQGALSMILDLRHNPGGYLETAIQVSSMFVPEGRPIVQMVSRGGKSETFYSYGSIWHGPLVVLADNASASASEIVAAAVKENGAGVVVGQQTFGKASVQTLLGLSNGGSLKLTTAKYLTPQGNDINGKGVEPNYTVAEDPGRDAALSKAVDLFNALPGASLGGNVIRLIPGQPAAWRNGQDIVLDAPSYLVNNRTMVPIRFVAESLGAQVGWQGATNQVDISLGGNKVTLILGNGTATVNGQLVQLDAAPALKNDRTMVPLRFVSEALGAQVDWDAATNMVTIIK